MDIAIFVDSIAKLRVFFESPDELISRNDQMQKMFTKIYAPILNYLQDEEINFVYYGSSFCEFQIPSVQELEEFCSLCDDKYIKKVLVTPPVTDFGIQRIKTFFRHIRQFRIDCDLVVNDFGVLTLAKEMDFSGRIWLGRVMDRSLHEVRMPLAEKRQYYSESGFEYMRQTFTTSASFAELMNQYGVSGAHIEYTEEDSIYSEQVSSALIYPTEYVTTGRMCWYRMLGQSEEEKYLLTHKCKKLCREVGIMMRRKIDHLVLDEEGNRMRERNFIRKGNTVYFCHGQNSFKKDFDEIENNEASYQRIVFDMSIL